MLPLKEYSNYLRRKGKVFATALSDFDCSNLDTEGECDSEGNYRAFMTPLILRMISAIWLMNLVIFSRMRKLKNRKMKTCSKMKGKSTYKKHMILYWKIVANTPKLWILLWKIWKRLKKSIGVYLCNTRKQSVKWKDSRESWLKLTLRSSFLNLKLFKLMSRLSAPPPRNLTMYCPLKNFHMIGPVWAIPEKGVQAANPRRKWSSFQLRVKRNYV